MANSNLLVFPSLLEAQQEFGHLFALSGVSLAEIRDEPETVLLVLVQDHQREHGPVNGKRAYVTDRRHLVETLRDFLRELHPTTEQQVLKTLKTIAIHPLEK